MNTEWSDELKPEPFTNWHNPTRFEQFIELTLPCNIARVSVDEDGNRRQWVQLQQTRRVTWPPGETKALPSRFDRAIHHVTGCKHPKCVAAGVYCQDPANAPASAVISGGLAPLLRREGQKVGFDVSIEPAAIAAGLMEGKEDPAVAAARARKAVAK